MEGAIQVMRRKIASVECGSDDRQITGGTWSPIERRSPFGIVQLTASLLSAPWLDSHYRACV
jgi:hypothetical protein